MIFLAVFVSSSLPVSSLYDNCFLVVALYLTYSTVVNVVQIQSSNSFQEFAKHWIIALNTKWWLISFF